MDLKNPQDCFKYNLTHYTFELKKLVNKLKTFHNYSK